jgi:hypothetical protein
MPEKLRPEIPGQKLQIRLENLSLLIPGGRLFTFPCQKIPASNYRYRQKIPRPVTAETARKSRLFGT